MTESQVANERIAKGDLQGQRRNLLELLAVRFPGTVPTEVTRLIEQHDSVDLLHSWFKVAIRATLEEFIAVLK